MWPVKAAPSLGLKSDGPVDLPLLASGRDPDPTGFRKKHSLWPLL